MDYKVGEVTRKQIGGSKECWNKLVEHMSMESTKNTKKFQFGDMFCGFPKDKRHIWANSIKDGLVHSRYNIAYPIILFFLFLLIILNQA
jgi:hypothetical protein